MTVKPIALGCDHGAYELKEALKKHFDEKKISYVDYGCDSTASVHYPIYAHKVCEAVQNGESELGILLCSTGIGMSMAANKHRGIRAALCSDTYSARFTRMHNDANVLCIGALTVGRGLAVDIVDTFLANSFEGGRHAERVKMFMELENK